MYSQNPVWSLVRIASVAGALLLTASAAFASGAGIDPERQASTLTILDNDGQTVTCTPGANTHCFLGGRFRAEVNWRTASGSVGRATTVNVTDNSGLFWLFNENNVEMLVKVQDTFTFSTCSQ